MDFFCERHKVMCFDWCEQCESDTSDVLTRRKLANGIRRAYGLDEIPVPPKCGCRGIVHTCNTIT